MAMQAFYMTSLLSSFEPVDEDVGAAERLAEH